MAPSSDVPDLSPITVVVPMPPPRANYRGTSRVASFAKVKYIKVLEGMMARGELVPPDRPFEFAHLDFTFRVKARGDNDGRLSQMKPLIDFLFKNSSGRSWIVADDPDHLDWPTGRQIIDPRCVPTVTVVIRPLAEKPFLERVTYPRSKAKPRKPRAA